MRLLGSFCVCLSGLVVRLYPKGFRGEFEEEMAAVLAEALAEAVESGGKSVLSLCMRELRDLPLNLLRAHWFSYRSEKGEEAMSQVTEYPADGRELGTLHGGPSIRWRAWIWWVAANTAGAAVGIVMTVALLVVAAVTMFRANEDRGVFVGIPVFLISIGIAQWLVMRRYIRRAGWWLPASIAGWIVGFGLIAALGAALGSRVDGLMPMVALLSILAASAGVMQWMVLRRQIRKAGWWVAGNVAGWVLSALLVGESLSNAIVDIVAIGPIPPLISGLVLAWLLRQPLSRVSDESAA